MHKINAFHSATLMTKLQLLHQYLSPQPDNHKLSQFLQQQHPQSERHYEQPDFGSNRQGAENRLTPSDIVDSNNQRNFQRNTPEFDAIVDQPSTKYTAPRRFTEKHIDDLRDDNGAQTGNGGLKV